MQSILDSLLPRGAADGCYPGAAAACGYGQKTCAISFAGKISQDGPAPNGRTLYDMASITKILAPTMIAFFAIEEGLLTLYDTIGTFFPDAPEDKREITILQLMSHCGGFVPSYHLSEAVGSPDGALGELLAHPLDYAPGTDVAYSCMGYIVLGKILEKIYGEGLDSLAKRRVFKPLGMNNTGYLPKGGVIAPTEMDKETGRPLCGVVHDENARFLGGVSANAGVFSCLEDMIVFVKMLACGGEGLLSPAMFQRAICCSAQTSEVRRGLGFHLAGTERNFMGDLMPECSFGHTGFTGTSFAVDPTTGFWAVLLTNRVYPTRENTRLFRFRREFHNALYAAFTREYAPGSR
ncbi:MAG: beta-lactamase family protein [Clostridia bacterium]|nr:beta-lactamase family protein [Clostridia bacterium]